MNDMSFENSNGDAQQSAVRTPSDGHLGENRKTTALTHSTHTAITESSLANNDQPVVRRERLNIVERDGELALAGDQESVRQTFGTSDPNLVSHFMLQAKLASPGSLLGPAHDGNSSLAALHGLAPRDALEGMLCAQMWAVHENAMELLQKANRPEQPDHVAEAHRVRAIKFMNTFTMQMKSLSEHRNNFTQNMVQQVHVHNGAQAIVGAIGVQQTGNEREDKHEKPGGPSAQKGLAKKRKPSR